jgi:hypothetical protein
MPTYITTQARTIANRRLKAGDEFVASRRDGALLVKLGRATEVPAALAQKTGFKVPPPPKPPAPAPVVEPEPAAVVTPESEASGEPPAPDVVAPPAEPVVDPLTVARDDYERIVGKRWFHGWDEAELRRRIDEFSGS